MEYTYQTTDTIAAIATPPGEGGVAIIRISGKQAIEIADKVFSGPVHKYQTHTAHYGYVVDSTGSVIDDAILLPFLGTRSFTGENTVEIHCHGGSLISKKVLAIVLKAGARAAEPGEFSYRSFVNGKLDLAQAEAIQELISAKNEYALRAAEKQLQGSLSEKIKTFQNELTDIAAMLEAWIDFPEEDIAFAPLQNVIKSLEQTKEEMTVLLNTFHDGKIAHEGVNLCFIGSPNVGKSSLMNAMLDKERAIVSHIPGTTRDIVEDNLRLGNLSFRLTDTAGIRETEELIEQEGVRRSKKAMEEADLILYVLDITQKITPHEKELLLNCPKDKTLICWNKADLTKNPPETINFPHVVSLSAKTKEGFDILKKEIDQIVWNKGPPNKDEVLLTNVRHKDALTNAISSCETLIHGLQEDTSPEFLTLDMRKCLGELGKIIGTDITEDILSAIFSQFCIGK